MGTSFVSYQIDGRAKQTITDRRNRLGTDAVECIECLHHWLASGTVASVSAELVIDESMIIDGQRGKTFRSRSDDVTISLMILIVIFVFSII